MNENPLEAPANSEAVVESDSAGPVDRPLAGDRAFAGFVSTQFLGAFNDNYFKQMVLLKCTELAAVTGAAGAMVDLQPLAMAAFALPFVMLSGIGGYISDRLSKRSVIVWCKVAEIVVMAASLAVLIMPGTTDESQLRMLILVLALMGAQSAIFGPPKYGILPELFHRKKLLPVNGATQMTTFLAIIFGMSGAGVALDNLDNSLWLCSLVAVVIAVVGTITSLMIRSTPVAQPDLKITKGSWFIPGDIWALFRRQPSILKATLVTSMFWFVGGVAQPAVNNLGEHVLHLSKTRTSLMAASIGLGIAVGCVTSGFLNRGGKGDGARWTTRGGWMIVGSLLLITLLGAGTCGYPIQSAGLQQGIVESLISANGPEWLLRLAMALLGFSAGVFVVPVQVYIQESPPSELKGRMIGTMNVVNWIGILLSALFLGVVGAASRSLLSQAHLHTQHYLIFAALAVMMFPVALMYRLPALSEAK